MYVQMGDFRVSRGFTTVPLTFHVTRFFPSPKIRVRRRPSVISKVIAEAAIILAFLNNFKIEGAFENHKIRFSKRILILKFLIQTEFHTDSLNPSHH